MLKDRVSKAKETIMGKGACRFCGQIAQFKALEEFNENELDELATELCECDGAITYTREKDRRERAHQRIDELFADEDNMTEERMTYIHGAVEPVMDGTLEKVAVTLASTIKAEIALTAKGNVKITKIKKEQSGAEV